MYKLVLHSKKEGSVLRRHPWVFSGAVAHQEAGIEDGDLVEVYHSNDTYLATGHYQDASIKVRLFSFEPTPADAGFWTRKIQQAADLRQQLGFVVPAKDSSNNATTNCFRLVNAEGDGCPGLVIDIYNQTAVIQCHSIGMHRQWSELTTALTRVFGESLSCIYNKSKQALPPNYAATVEDGCLYGSSSKDILVVENGHTFHIDYQTGQKTGFFLDQRDNRQLLAQYAPDKNILNAYCYSGGFSVYGLAKGARRVHSVDASAKAMALCQKNVEANIDDAAARHTSFTSDVNHFFKESTEVYDLIVLDPPAFAKNDRNDIMRYRATNASTPLPCGK